MSYGPLHTIQDCDGNLTTVEALTVSLVELQTPAPFSRLTPQAARQLAKQLSEAADDAEGSHGTA